MAQEVAVAMLEGKSPLQMARTNGLHKSNVETYMRVLGKLTESEFALIVQMFPTSQGVINMLSYNPLAEK